MKKKVFSLVLVLCMLVSMIPSTAFADDLEWGEVRVYSYYSDIGIVWGYAGADPVGVPETEIAEEKEGYTFQGWYRVTALDESGIATAYGELLCATPTYNYTMEKYLAMVAVYERTTMSPNALKLTAHYQDRNGNTIREDGDVQFGDYTVECQDVAPTIDGYKYLYKQIAGGASGYTFYHVKKDAADSPWNPSYYGITGDGQSVILTEPVEIIYYYYMPSSPAGYPTAYYQDENGKELHASETLSLDEDGGIWLTEPVGEYDSYKVLAPSIDGYTIKEIHVTDGQGFTNLADMEHGLHLKGWDDYYGEWVFHSGDGEVTAAHGTPICTYIYTADAQTPHEHSWDDGVVQKAATTEEPGIMLYSCTVCGETKTEEIPKLEQEVLSGKCGDNLTYTLVNGILTISGTGEMWNYSSKYRPGWENATKAILMPGVTTIGDYAFANFTTLLSVSLPDGLTCIGKNAFRGCDNLYDINFPESITEIGEWSFSGTFLPNIDLPSNRHIELPSSLESIGKCAFCGSGLESIVIPDKIIEIPYGAFSECAHLSSIILPQNLTIVGEEAFSQCNSLLSVKLPNSVISVGKRAFWFCTNLNSVILSQSLTQISSGMFSECWSLSHIDLPAGLTDIESSAFSNCHALTEITIPAEVDGIAEGAFISCTNLENINVNDGNVSYYSVDGILFNDNVLVCYPARKSGATYGIPQNVNIIASAAFNSTCNLQTVDIPSYVREIGRSAFVDSSIRSISIPDSITEIKYCTFWNCQELNRIALPASIVTIVQDAFRNCVSLSDVYYVGSEREWNEITIENNNGYLTSATIHYNSTKPESEIRSGVCGDNLTWHLDDEGVLTVSGIGRMYDYSDTVDSGAPWFPVKDQIKKVVLGEGVLSIGDYAFDRCEKLAHIAVPVKTIRVGRGAFNRCVSLTSVTFPTNGFEGVSEIGIGAFSECSNLTNITLPDTLTTVWDSAFFGCTALADIYYMGYEKDWISVIIQPGNECLTEAEFHSKQPTAIDVALQGSSAYYDNDLALIAAELSLATYTGDGDSDVRAYLCGLGFSSSKIYSNNYGGSLAFTIGTKPYFGNDMSGCTDILVIVAQGSTNPYELFKDAFARVTGTGGYLTHSIVEDFYNAINEGLQYMMDRNLLSNDKNYKIFLTGHSLGGAAVDFLAGILTDNNGANDVYCYTFGAINSIVANSSLGYRNIHNVYNDLDTFSPAQYGWMLINGAGGKYGKIGHLDSFEYDYRDPVLASWWGAVVQVSNHINHDMGNYLEAVRAGRVTNSPLRSCPYAIIACPVDVDVFCDGVLVGRVKNNVVDKTVTTIDIIVDGDVKFILNPENKKFDITITAFDEGTMTYYTQNSSGFGEAKLMYNIELVPGKEMISQFGGDIEIPDIKLYVLGGDDTPIREAHEDGTETAITHIHKWDEGVITTPATCDADGVMTYTCSVCGETKTETISAAGHKWDAGTVTKAATCTEAGVMTYTCTACGINGTTEIPALGHNYEGGVCKTCGGAQPGFAPKIIEGSGGTAHYGSDYSFRSDAAFNTFLAVYVNGAELSATNYTAKEGSTIVTLKGSYIKTLAAGTHTIRIASTLGNADGTFKVSESPKTGDTSDLFKWSFLAVDSLVCLGCLWGLYLLASKKRRAYDPRH